MRINLGVFLFALSLSLPLGGATFAQATYQQVAELKTAKQFVAAGAEKLSAADFSKKIVGKQMNGGGWSWIIKKDGTTDSVSDDGSWKEVGAPWTLKGDQYCIVEKGKDKCRSVYLLGNLMRMEEKSGKLSPWTAQVR